jgi:hypothetical protein
MLFSGKQISYGVLYGIYTLARAYALPLPACPSVATYLPVGPAQVANTGVCTRKKHVSQAVAGRWAHTRHTLKKFLRATDCLSPLQTSQMKQISFTTIFTNEHE